MSASRVMLTMLWFKNEQVESITISIQPFRLLLYTFIHNVASLPLYLDPGLPLHIDQAWNDNISVHLLLPKVFSVDLNQGGRIGHQYILHILLHLDNIPGIDLQHTVSWYILQSLDDMFLHDCYICIFHKRAQDLFQTYDGIHIRNYSNP